MLPPALDRGGRELGVTTFEEDDYIFQALHAGAAGFLLKDVEPDALRDAVRTVAAGDGLLSPSVTRRLISAYVTQPSRHRPAPTELDELTHREREITALVAAGLTNADIAERLVISRATAKTHVNRAMAKVGARDRAQLVVLAYESGLVSPRTPARVARQSQETGRLGLRDAIHELMSERAPDSNL